jgi:aminopeptidase N
MSSSSASAKAKIKAAASASAEDEFAGSESGSDDGLLPKSVSPVHYKLRLVPDYTTWTFRAQLNVMLKISEETDQIQFNAADLEIDVASVRIGTPSDSASPDATVPMNPSRISHDEEEEVTTLRFSDPLPVGDAVLSIAYRGLIGNEMIGLYRSHYTHEGKQHTILVTQFEACDGRRCLPCWSEWHAAFSHFACG